MIFQLERRSGPVLRVETLKGLVNQLIGEEVAASGVPFRLPAPVASCSAENPLWHELRRSHPWMRLPQELLPGARGVIVFALPISSEAIRSNLDGDYPSHQWLRDYIVANDILWRVAVKLSSILEERGHRSLPMRPTHDFDEENLIASWSHRHAGYICGLGTFGLHNLLITEMGCAVRLNSLITDAIVEESPRPSFEYCLAKRGLRCDACLRRCPVGALDDWSSGKRRCYERLLEVANSSSLGYADACGKCSTGVPCSTSIPLYESRNLR